MTKTYIQAPTNDIQQHLFHNGYRVRRDENRKIFATTPDGQQIYSGDNVSEAWTRCDVHAHPEKYQRHQQTSIEGKSGKIKIYFAGSIRGGRDLQPIYQHIILYLQRHGYQVLSEHVGSELNASGEQRDSSEIYQRDIAWINEADVVIADVTVPSLGVGYEVAYAQLLAKKPVLCVAQMEANVSAMIDGSGVKLLYYTNAEHLETTVYAWLYMFRKGEL